jgi:Mg-chelatase subunit ChlD
MDVQKVYNTLRNFITGFDLETQLRNPRVKSYLSRHKQSQVTSDRGRRINTIPYQSGFSLALVPSIQSAITSGHYNSSQHRVSMTKDNLLMWQLRAKISMTLAFIIDASASTRHFIKVIAHMLALLYRDAYRKKDKIGLVIFKENKAQVLIHPTRNYQLVLGSLVRIAPSGWTPLASGLEKAYTILKEELRREREMIPCAVLVSDCYPEPLTHKFKDIFEEPAYQDVLRVANMYKREKIPVVVINPYHNLEDPRFNIGSKLGMSVARISNGKYFGVPKEEADNFSWGRMSQGLIKKYASKIGGLFDEVKTDAFQTYKIPGLSQEDTAKPKVT